MQQPHRQRDRVAARDAREPQPVPALEDVLERRLDAGAEAEPAGEALRHLAVHRERLAGQRRPCVDRRPRPSRRGCSGSRPRPTFERRNASDLGGVARVDERERGPRHDVVAVELRRLVPVRGAARGVEQRDVVRVDELLRRRSGELAEPDREHGGAQRVLERLPGAEIGRERQRPDHLGRANRLLARREHRRCVLPDPPPPRRDPNPVPLGYDVTLGSEMLILTARIGLD